MTDKRHKDVNWVIHTNDNGTVPTQDAHLAVLMDIRDELKSINSTLKCSETQSIPRMLRRISANTHKPKRKKKAVV